MAYGLIFVDSGGGGRGDLGYGAMGGYSHGGRGLVGGLCLQIEI